MHIYSLRLWLVMIAIFTGVSAAQAEDKCWILRKWSVTKGQPAGKPKQMSQCLEGKIVTKNEKQTCDRWDRGETTSVGNYFIDKDCNISLPAMLNENTAKIPDAKVHDGAQAKKEKAHKQREDEAGRKAFERERARVTREGGTVVTPYGGIGSAPPEQKKPAGSFGFGSAVSEPAE